MKKIKNIFIMILSSMVLLTFISCKVIENTPEKTLSKLKKINSYESNFDVIYLNEREERQEDCKQYYSKDKGYVLQIGEARTYFYKDGNINITDNIAEKKYIVDNDFDEVYKYTCLEEVLNLITDNDSKIETKEYEGKKLLAINFILPGVNRNLAKGELIVDMDTNYPQEMNIYDLKGEKRINVIYKNFVLNSDVNHDIFKE